MIITMYRRKWKFSVMSAEDAEDFIRQPHFERIRFISITEANGYHIDFHKCEGNITFLPLKFDDCTTDLEGTCITDVQAKDIVKFVLDNNEEDKTDWFCVNCGAGVSYPAALEYTAIPPCCCPGPGSVFPSFPPGNWQVRRSSQREPLRQWQSLGSCFRPACGRRCLTDGRSSHGTWGPPGISAVPLWRRPCPPLPGIPPLRSLPCSRKSCSFLLPGGRPLH